MARVTDHDEFLRLITLHQGQLYAYLYALLHNMPDTEDVLQNTIVVLWKKFDQFEPGSNFLHWAMRTARFEALRFQRSMRREQQFFSEDLVETLSTGAFSAVEEDLALQRRQALHGCLKKLGDADRTLLQSCYDTGVTVSAIATLRGRSVQSVCNSLRRIRQMLFECIERTIARGEDCT